MNTHDDVLKINFEPLIFRILGGRYLLVEPLITHENSKLSKISSFYYFAIIFFPVKADMLYFSKIGKGDQKGDHLELYICLKDQFGFEIFKKNLKVETNIDLQVVPLLVPLSNF